MVSIIPSFISAMACVEYILTIVIAMARGVGRGTDKSVIQIGAIYAAYMLAILNLKRMLA
jgi:hypothetical protein